MTDAGNREAAPGTLEHAIPAGGNAGADEAVLDTVRMYSSMVREACSDLPQDAQPAEVYRVVVPERSTHGQPE